MMLVDAFSTRSVLAQDPRIDKIGIAGWSLGGTVALYSAWSPIIDILGSAFDAHLPFYPAAHIRPDIKIGEFDQFWISGRIWAAG
jgi:dienelactone hydrolase